MSTDFEQRNNEILAAIVEAHVESATPVGSELICRKLRQRVSSATIRNVMVELEEQGLLEQPHTSAGRVPTDQGYRYYVDRLMPTAGLPADTALRLAKLIQPREPELQELLERTGEALAEVTGLAGFVVAPSVRRSMIRQIELMPLTTHKIVCVLVSEEPQVISHVIDIEESLSREETLVLARFLNDALAGLSSLELLEALQRRLLAANDSLYHLVRRSQMILEQMLAVEPEAHFAIEGAANLVQQPEFAHSPERVLELFHCVESPEHLLARVRTDLDPQTGARARVRIGHELAVDGLDPCSYVVAPFGVQRQLMGGIGVLGPKRMEYARVCALVDRMADLVSRTLSQWSRG